jgi:hypothetical protein
MKDEIGSESCSAVGRYRCFTETVIWYLQQDSRVLKYKKADFEVSFPFLEIAQNLLTRLR